MRIRDSFQQVSWHKLQVIHPSVKKLMPEGEAFGFPESRLTVFRPSGLRLLAATSGIVAHKESSGQFQIICGLDDWVILRQLALSAHETVGIHVVQGLKEQEIKQLFVMRDRLWSSLRHPKKGWSQIFGHRWRVIHEEGGFDDWLSSAVFCSSFSQSLIEQDVCGYASGGMTRGIKKQGKA